MKDWLSRCNQTKEKHLLHSFHITCLVCSTYNFLTTGSELLHVPSIFACLYFTLVPSLLHNTQALQKSCQGNFWKFQGPSKSRFGGSEKDCYFLKIPKWQHKHVRDYKRGKLVSYFLNNAAKTCLYGLKFSENIDIEHVFQSKAFFLLSSNLYTSCLNAFNRQRVHSSNNVKYLGISIDENLQWKHHVNDVSTKLIRANAILFKIRNYVNWKIPSSSILLFLNPT